MDGEILIAASRRECGVTAEHDALHPEHRAVKGCAACRGRSRAKQDPRMGLAPKQTKDAT